ncbi:sigma-54 interaction domain-containing protein [Novosphingobium sp. 9]|uniref:sigma-54 interaction domain-containing protein n=1 Tax=Novosphingobium sp. 9 TaxID=2025349 RepID=UPI0021B6C4C7|nr:sigma-54 dependent transcriptional regulator [Novosphingobium sp. 9]
MVDTAFDTEKSWSISREHGPLARRAAGIAASLYDIAAIDLRDAEQHRPARPRSRVVGLARGSKPALTREGGNRILLTYADPASEGALALVLAALAGPQEPIAADPQSLAVFALAERLAASDIPVLINGPTGTGKEVLSRFIHARSPRADKPFIAVNCAAMPETMLEAMLFGHQKGAFTGATAASEGFMRAADGGTLLLDEIAEMPLTLQAKLLRALQEQEVVPVGASRAIKVDVRIIACANRDLPTEVAEGRFRADLFYRLNVFPLQLAPLRERADDIAPLACAMVLRHSQDRAHDPKAIPCLSEASLALLKLHSWPGNVRELENVIRRALLLAQGSALIEPEHIVFDRPARLVQPFASSPFTAPLVELPASPEHANAESSNTGRDHNLASVVQTSQARVILEVLEACGGNRLRAARELGISERTLRYRLASMREAGIEVGRMAGSAR